MNPPGYNTYDGKENGLHEPWPFHGKPWIIVQFCIAGVSMSDLLLMPTLPLGIQGLIPVVMQPPIIRHCSLAFLTTPLILNLWQRGALSTRKRHAGVIFHICNWVRPDVNGNSSFFCGMIMPNVTLCRIVGRQSVWHTSKGFQIIEATRKRRICSSMLSCCIYTTECDVLGRMYLTHQHPSYATLAAGCHRLSECWVAASYLSWMLQPNSVA